MQRIVVHQLRMCGYNIAQGRGVSLGLHSRCQAVGASAVHFHSDGNLDLFLISS